LPEFGLTRVFWRITGQADSNSSLQQNAGHAVRLGIASLLPRIRRKPKIGDIEWARQVLMHSRIVIVENEGKLLCRTG
jgi:hypothetical protein